jgi:23S rRNA (cytidine1920-2'-O)/16S rRNA (cytidine1409-2'-O)-methyltransferase
MATSTAKQRLDQLLVTLGLVESRAKAQALIMSGHVLVNDVPVTKAGQVVMSDAAIRLKGKDHPWVSRGGQKLAHAMEAFRLEIGGGVAIDVGASTGGFTDVLLHHGAERVYAVDVGHGQLDWKLRQDARVVVWEKTNARALDSSHVPELVDAVVCDASFISLKTVLPAALALTKPDAWLCALIKPQFEAGREHVGKGGVIRDAAIHQAVCYDMVAWLGGLDGWTVEGVATSPITGPKGNKEFLVVGRKIA